MLIDFTSNNPKVQDYTRRLIARFPGIKCFINGREVQQVYYVNANVKPHVVKSYDALGDGKAHCFAEFPQDVRQHWPRSVGIMPSGILSKTIRGKVTFAVPTKLLIKRHAAAASIQ